MRAFLPVVAAFFTVAWGSDIPIPPLAPPIQGLREDQVRDMFTEVHNGHPHEAIDIMEPKGTPIHAVAPGTIKKLFLSKPGGITVYQFDEAGVFCYYYAHLDGYAPGVHEGMQLKTGDVIGFVGSTGNAVASAPHLHFAIFRMGTEKQYWKGTAVDPYSSLIDAVRRRR